MAKTANPGSVAADIRPADYRAAVQRIRTITAKKEKVATANGEIADVWGKVEALKVGKDAGRAFLKLDGWEGEDRLRFMRDLNGLIDAAGWPEVDSDLVDQSEGKVVQMRVGAKGGDDEGGEGGGEDGGESGGEEPGPGPEPEPEVKAKRGGRAPAMTDALEAARNRLGTGARKPPADDSDLAGGAAIH